MPACQVNKKNRTQPDLLGIYQLLLGFYGHRNWWPGETQDEIAIGAILTQSVAWKNVETALARLRDQGILTLRDIAAAPAEHIAPLIRSTLYYNQKTQKLKAFARWFGTTYDFDWRRMFSTPVPELRHQLLSLKGLGPETADSILLYAGRLPVFVIDAYTRRLFKRLDLTPAKDSYPDWQQYFSARLPVDPGLYNDFHAQIVHHCKILCQPVPKCADCPLGRLCPGKT